MAALNPENNRKLLHCNTIANTTVAQIHQLCYDATSFGLPGPQGNINNQESVRPVLTIGQTRFYLFVCALGGPNDCTWK